MRRRLVLSTIAVVLVVILVLFIPVLLVVRDGSQRFVAVPLLKA